LSPASPARRPARPATTTTARNTGKSAASGGASSSKRSPIALIVGVVLAIGLVVVIVLTMGSGNSVDDSNEVGTPAVAGTPLPEFDTVQNDTALGLTIPEVTGSDFAGTPVSITLDGRPKVLMFFAHWCGVCQQEVPLITGWLPTATLPGTLDLISVSTGVNPNAANYPPSLWLEREGWPVPVIRDDASGTVAASFGLSAYPYFVFVDGDGRVVLRATGGLPTEALEQIITQLTGA